MQQPGDRGGGDSLPGFLFALAAYLMWGLLPLYLKAVAHVPPLEVVAHRVIWSVPVAGAVILATGRSADLRAAVRAPRSLGMAAGMAALISVNWLIYVWAIGAGHALDTALGYFINPLLSVLLAAVLLGERLSRLQLAAVALAGLAVTILTVASGQLPVIGLSLSLTFAFYGFFKKSLPIGPNQGFFLEVLLIAPAALAYAVWLARSGQAHFLAGSLRDTLLLIGCGPATAVPLILFANGARRLRLSTIGIMQYIAPTMIFLTAVFLFHEPFDRVRAITFPMIWAALAIYSLSLIGRMRQKAN